MASIGAATAGKSMQDAFDAINDNVTTEETKKDNMHTDAMPVDTPELTQHLNHHHHPNSSSAETISTTRDTSLAPLKLTSPTTPQEPPPPTNQPPNTFTGYLATSPTSPLTHAPFPPKAFLPTDIDIAITHCGLCFSDISTYRSSWSPTLYPICLGHEIIGTAIRIGASARAGIRLGDRVGVGPQGYNCHLRSCQSCSSGRENYCPVRVGTYGERYGDGSGVSQGGFADFTRQDSNSVFGIPEGLDSASAAVMLCAGATVFEPLKEHGAATPGKRVGIVGLGGLGHLGVLFAKAMGCEYVVAVSRKEDKREDAMKLGADGYIATADEEGWAETHATSLDLIICTVSGPGMPLMEYLGLLRPKGVFCQVGIPEGSLPQLDTMALVLNGTSICFSDSASPGNVREMLSLAAKKGVRAWTECRPMVEINSVMKEMEEGRARFRYVMVNEESEKEIQKTE